MKRLTVDCGASSRSAPQCDCVIGGEAGTSRGSSQLDPPRDFAVRALRSRERRQPPRSSRGKHLRRRRRRVSCRVSSRWPWTLKDDHRRSRMKDPDHAARRNRLSTAGSKRIAMSCRGSFPISSSLTPQARGHRLSHGECPVVFQEELCHPSCRKPKCWPCHEGKT